MNEKKDLIQKALEQISEAANSLATHGAGGYTVDTSALDTVFVRSLINLYTALSKELDYSERYDPYGDVFNALPPG